MTGISGIRIKKNLFIVSNSFLLLVVRHLLLEAMHLFLVARVESRDLRPENRETQTSADGLNHEHSTGPCWHSSWEKCSFGSLVPLHMKSIVEQ